MRRKTMLGETQRAWLVDGVQRSTATFKLVFTSVPLDFGDRRRSLDGFTTERDAAVRRARRRARRRCSSARDQHWFAAHRHAHGIREFQVGPLARGLGIAGRRRRRACCFAAGSYNFGLIDVDGDQLTFSRRRRGRRACFYKETLSAADLTPTS